MGMISLLTDFGAHDWFVGTMKGVITGIAPEATVVDLSHQVPPGDVRHAAFILRAAAGYFPKGTIHVAVVDPAVGTSRPALVVQTDRYYFVGPGNGVLDWALANEKVRAVRRLENPEWFRRNISRTFHGRDIFAPASARLARGDHMNECGSEVIYLPSLRWPAPGRKDERLVGEVLYVDHFGNAITNLPAPEDLRIPKGIEGIRLESSGKIFPWTEAYARLPEGGHGAVPGSTSLWELAINRGRAAEANQIQPGDLVSAPIEAFPGN